tara:strand:+ start:136 stop:915 length:780 start_codon:yes stop_codon:yes gene_type:complete
MGDDINSWDIPIDFKLLINMLILNNNLESKNKKNYIEFGMIYNSTNNEYKLKLPNNEETQNKIHIMMNIIKNIIIKHLQNNQEFKPNLHGLHIKINKIQNDELQKKKKIILKINNSNKNFESFGINLIIGSEHSESMSVHDINESFQQNVKECNSIIIISILFIKKNKIENSINFNGYPIELIQYIEDILKIFSNKRQILSPSLSMDSLPEVKADSCPCLHSLLPDDMIKTLFKSNEGDITPKLSEYRFTPEPPELFAF